MTNPSKKDLSFVTGFINNPKFSAVNFTLWVIFEPEIWKAIKKDMRMEDYHIVMDLSFEKNEYVCGGMYEDMIDQRLDCFLGDLSRSQILPH